MVTDVVSEEEQLRRFNVYRKLTQIILLRHGVQLGIFFIIVFVVILGLLAIRVKNSPERYMAVAKLVYYPKTSSRIDSLDSNQLMQQLSRYSLFQQFASRMAMDWVMMQDRLELTQDSNNTNWFIITSRSDTAENAVYLANSFAEFCIREYINSRNSELSKWEYLFVTQENNIQSTLNQITDAMHRIAINSEAMSPAQEIEKLQATVVEQRIALSELSVKLSNLKDESASLTALFGEYNPLLSQYSGRIRDYMNDLSNLDKELLVARQLYTEINPKLLSMESQRVQLEEEYRNFLKENNIGEVTAEQLDNIDRINAALEKIAKEVFALQNSHAALTDAIAINERKLQQLHGIMPEYTHLQTQYDTQVLNLQKVADIKVELNYQKNSVDSEFALAERAEFAQEELLFSKLNIFISLFGALFLTGMLAFIVVFLSIIFGNVYNLKELYLYSELNPIGAIPASEKFFKTQEDERFVIETMFHRMQRAGALARVIFTAPLLGTTLNHRLQHYFDWNYAMCGMKIFRLQVVRKDTLPDDIRADYTATVRNQDSGLFPVENPYTLTSTEFELLKADIEELRHSYDTVIISREEPLVRKGVFCRQILPICESSALIVGEKTTPRSLVRYLIKLQRAGGYNFISVLNESEDEQAVNKGEY